VSRRAESAAVDQEAQGASGATDPFWPVALAGAVANFTGVGIGRFAYTPLVPALVQAGWVTPAQAGYAGAANLAGYLLGAVLSLSVLSGRPAGIVVRAALALSAVGAFACAWPLGFGWLAAWRFVVGAAGSVLMIVGTSAALARIPAARRGLGSGVVFTGVGVGIAASSLIVPALVSQGLAATWSAFALAIALASAAGWTQWRADPVGAPPPGAGVVPSSARGLVLLVLAVYGFDTIGWVPHTIFWIDYIARDLGLGLSAGAAYWSLFGLGALAGPLVGGTLAGRLGAGPALLVVTLVKLSAVAAPLAGAHVIGLVFSSVVIGAFAPGTAALVSARLAEVLPADALRIAWARATLVFATAQTVGGFLMARLHDQLGGARPLFAVGCGFMVLSAAAAALVARRNWAQARIRPPSTGMVWPST
jgi:predicted MFS family arabinose efflux permease